MASLLDLKMNDFSDKNWVTILRLFKANNIEELKRYLKDVLGLSDKEIQELMDFLGNLSSVKFESLLKLHKKFLSNSGDDYLKGPSLPGDN